MRYIKFYDYETVIDESNYNKYLIRNYIELKIIKMYNRKAISDYTIYLENKNFLTFRIIITNCIENIVYSFKYNL